MTDMTEEQGVQAIIDLQAFAGIDESRDDAIRGWRGMTEEERIKTELAYALLLPDKHAAMLDS